MDRVFVGLGSNIGDRFGYLQKALDVVGKVRSTRVKNVSSVYETAPVGDANQSDFLNAVAELSTGLEPGELFMELKGIEKLLGRSPSRRWGPREIDIDILLYDGLVFQDDEVTVPHAEMERRKFVLVPLREIAPDLVHPVSGMTMEELVAACKDTGRVVQSYHKIIL